MRKLTLLMILLLSLLLGACQQNDRAIPATTELTESTEAAIPTQEPTAQPTPEPTEEVAEAEGERSDLDTLVQHPWQWVAFTNPVEQFDVQDPQNYQVAFNEDGTVNIKADCNNAGGSYTVDESSMTIEIGPMTMAACPPGSLSDRFVNYLGFSAIYFFQDGHLFIDLFADGGTLEFAPGQ